MVKVQEVVRRGIAGKIKARGGCNAVTSLIVAIVALVLVMSGAMIVSLNKLVFSRLAKTMDVATCVVGGDFNRQIVPGSRDEVGKLEELLEQFRTVFINTVQDMQQDNQRLAASENRPVDL